MKSGAPVVRSEPDLEKAINDHIWYELQWLGRAAERFRELCGQDRRFEVNFLDSALIHARLMIEFFTGRQQDSDIKLNDFGGWNPLPLSLERAGYDWAKEWLESIDKRVAHLSFDRNSPPLPPVAQPEPADGTNWGIHELTSALMVLWDGFAAHLRSQGKTRLANALQSKIDQTYKEWGCTRAEARETVKNRLKKL
jgi:hypothetical protein